MAAFILSLLGGIFMIIGGTLPLAFFRAVSYGEEYGHRGWHMMDMMGWGMMGFFTWFWIIGLISGVIVLVAAIMLYSKPRETTLWGVLIIVFSVISLLGAGGFFIGFILGLIGGILALTWKHK